jgi:hypothetical protein
MLADALNKEEIIFPCTNNLAAVFVSAQHWGAGLGTFDSVQTDYFRDPGAI